MFLSFDVPHKNKVYVLGVPLKLKYTSYKDVKH